MKAIYVFLILSILVNGCFQPSNYIYNERTSQKDRMSGLTVMGIKYYENGSIIGAIKGFEGALNRSNKDKKGRDTCLYNLAIACLASKTRINEGIKYLELINQPQNFGNFYQNLAIGYLLEKEFKKAKENLEKADKTKVITWYLLGRVSLEEGNIKEAHIFFDKARKMSINKVSILPMAEASYRVNELKHETLNLFKKVSKNKDEIINLKIANLGEVIINVDLGIDRKAFRLLDKMNAKDRDVIYTKGYLHYKRGEDFLAKVTFENLVNRFPKSADGYIGLAYISAKEASNSDSLLLWRRAVEFCSLAIKFEPKPAYYEFRALCQFMMFDYRKQGSDDFIISAMKDIDHIKKTYNWNISYETRIAQAKSFHYVYYLLLFKRYSSSHFQKENMGNYLMYAKNAYRAAIEQDSLRVDAHKGLARLFLEVKDFKNAIKYFEQSENINKDISNEIGIAMSNFEIGDLVRSKKIFENVLAKDPKNIQAIIGIGLILFNDDKTKLEGRILLENVFFLKDQNDLDDIVKATIFFNWATAKMYDFKKSNYKHNEKGLESFLKDEIMPIYEKARVITPLADSSVYYANLGYFAEKEGFKGSAKKYYNSSFNIGAVNNIGIMLAKNDQVDDAEKIFSKIKDISAIAKQNLFFLNEGKIDQLTSIYYRYLHLPYKLEHIEPTFDYPNLPKYERELNPISDFYAFGEPKLIKQSRFKKQNRRKSGKSSTNCPK